MPATSQQQQKLFGLALAVKRGEVSPSEVSDEVRDIVDRMSEKDIEDFAGTKHAGLPKKVEAQIREMVREIMRERVISEMSEEPIEEASTPSIKMVNKFEPKEGIQIMAVKTLDGKTHFGGMVQRGKFARIIPFVPNQSKSDVEKRALQIYDELEKDESVNEGKKVFKVNPQIGKAKYSISSHDGVKKHKDGSDFFDIEIFKNKVDLEKAIKNYKSKGFVEESVNEAMKPSQVRSAISKVKKELMRKWKQKGGYENFGQKELSQMKDKFDYNPYGSSDEREIAKMLDGFDNWAMNYDGNMREDLNEALTADPRKVYGGTGAKEGMVLVAQKGLQTILDLSKKNPSNVFLVSDDNYTKFGPYYVKNGKVAKYTVANPNYDLEKNKVRSLKVPSDVILKFKIVEGAQPMDEQSRFTATSKETGTVSIFKTKAERDAAVKSGSHEMKKSDK